MIKEISNTYKFECDTYEELVSKIYSLQQNGFVIEFGEITDNYTYILQAKRINGTMIKEGNYSPTYIIYGENYVVLREGVNDIEEIYKNSKNKMNQEEKKKYCYDLENNVENKDKSFLKLLDDRDIFALIDLALDRGDTDRVEFLSKYLKKST